MPQNIIACADRYNFDSRVGVLLKRGTGDRGDPYQFARGLEWSEENPPDYLVHSPTFELTPDAAQHLMDNLWSAGLRPTQGKQSEGAMAAMAAHLEDMRVIAFNGLKIPKP